MNCYPELLWIIINIIILFIQNLSCELLSFISSCGFLQYGALVWGVWRHVSLQRLLRVHSVAPPGFSAAVVIASVALQVCTTESLCFAIGAFSRQSGCLAPGRCNSEECKHGAADATGSHSPPAVRKSAGKFPSLLSFRWDVASELCCLWCLWRSPTGLSAVFITPLTSPLKVLFASFSSFPDSLTSSLSLLEISLPNKWLYPCPCLRRVLSGEYKD